MNHADRKKKDDVGVKSEKSPTAGGQTGCWMLGRVHVERDKMEISQRLIRARAAGVCRSHSQRQDHSMWSHTALTPER